MVAYKDFSGFAISAWALASAAASAPTHSLQRCMADLRFHKLKANRAGPRALAGTPCPEASASSGTRAFSSALAWSWSSAAAAGQPLEVTLPTHSSRSCRRF
jgi:hypothetical protein